MSKSWTTIRDFDDALQYCNRLGIVSDHEKLPGWIPQFQKELCQLADRVRDASGQSTWYHKTFKPFQVQYSRELDQFHVRFLDAP